MAIILIRTVIVDVWVKVAVRVLASFASIAGWVFSAGLITLIPEILLSKYNIGGYNREITREQLIKQRNVCIDSVIKEMLKTRNPNSTVTYLSIESQDDKYITPLITPEFIYNLCLINFHITHPDDVIAIGHTGIDKVEEEQILNEYLSFITINSAGQRVFINNYNDLSVLSSLNNMIGHDSTLPKDDDSAPPILENMSDVIQQKVDYLLYDIKSLDIPSSLIASNKDLYVLMASISMVSMLSFMLYLLFCNYCSPHYKSIGLLIACVFIACSSLSLHYIWLKVFKSRIKK